MGAEPKATRGAPSLESISDRAPCMLAPARDAGLDAVLVDLEGGPNTFASSLLTGLESVGESS